jgi:hypothetical protein
MHTKQHGQARGPAPVIDDAIPDENSINSTQVIIYRIDFQGEI